jgi:hypothetical protein
MSLLFNPHILVSEAEETEEDASREIEKNAG